MLYITRLLYIILKVLYHVHWSLSRGKSPQFIPSHPISVRSVLILFSIFRLNILGGFFPSGFPAKILHAFVFNSMRSTCHAYLILLGYTRLNVWNSFCMCMLGMTTVLDCGIPFSLKGRADIRLNKGTHVLRVKVKNMFCMLFIREIESFFCEFMGHANMKAFVDHVSTYELQYTFSFVCRLLFNNPKI